MTKVIKRYERFISSEDEMEVYNARDAFLYGQTLMLKREREEGRERGGGEKRGRTEKKGRQGEKGFLEDLRQL